MELLTPAPAAPKMVDVPVAVVMVLPSLFVPVENNVSVEIGVEDPLPPEPAPAAPLKMVDVPTAVVMVLPPVVMVEKVVSVEMGVPEPLPEPLPEPPAPPAPPPPVAVIAEVATRLPTELLALEAEAAADNNQFTVQFGSHRLDKTHLQSTIGWHTIRWGTDRYPRGKILWSSHERHSQSRPLCRGRQHQHLGSPEYRRCRACFANSFAVKSCQSTMLW